MAPVAGVLGALAWRTCRSTTRSRRPTDARFRSPSTACPTVRSCSATTERRARRPSTAPSARPPTRSACACSPTTAPATAARPRAPGAASATWPGTSPRSSTRSASRASRPTADRAAARTRWPAARCSATAARPSRRSPASGPPTPPTSTGWPGMGEGNHAEVAAARAGPGRSSSPTAAPTRPRSRRSAPRSSSTRCARISARSTRPSLTGELAEHVLASMRRGARPRGRGLGRRRLRVPRAVGLRRRRRARPGPRVAGRGGPHGPAEPRPLAAAPPRGAEGEVLPGEGHLTFRPRIGGILGWLRGGWTDRRRRPAPARGSGRRAAALARGLRRARREAVGHRRDEPVQAAPHQRARAGDLRQEVDTQRISVPPADRREVDLAAVVADRQARAWV